MSFAFSGAYAIPGIEAALETIENNFWWGRHELNSYIGVVIDGASLDTGNTGYTSKLRPGLLMGQVTTGSKWKPLDITGTAVTGEHVAGGILVTAQQTQLGGSDKDRWAWIMVGGNVKARNLIVPGQTSAGLTNSTLEYSIRAQMNNRFIFDDNLQGTPLSGFSTIVTRTTSYTVTEGDHGTLFSTRGAAGAVTFTLPTVVDAGLHYGFYNAADQNMIVASGTVDTTVVYNDLTADSLAFQTSSRKIGGMVEVFADGTGWLSRVSMGDPAQTVTYAT